MAKDRACYASPRWPGMSGLHPQASLSLELSLSYSCSTMHGVSTVAWCTHCTSQRVWFAHHTLPMVSLPVSQGGAQSLGKNAALSPLFSVSLLHPMERVSVCGASCLVSFCTPKKTYSYNIRGPGRTIALCFSVCHHRVQSECAPSATDASGAPLHRTDIPNGH